MFEFAKAELPESPEKSQSGRIVLVRPLTFMNESGAAVTAVLQEFRVKPQEMLVLFDDIDIPLGEIRIRKSGSHGGHRGMESVLAELGTNDVPRLRMGIGPKPAGLDSAEWVLMRFAKGDEKMVKNMVGLAAEAALACISEGVESAMNRYNGRIA